MRTAMDSETQELLMLTLKALRQTVETSRNNAEMNWKLWAALREKLVGFDAAYEAHKGVSFEHLHRLTASLIEQLDAAIHRLEK